MIFPYPFTSRVPLTQHQQEKGLSWEPFVRAQPTCSREGVTERQPTLLILEENARIEELLRYALLTAGYHHIVTMHEIEALIRTDQHVDLLLFDLDGSLVWMKTVACLWHLIQEQEQTDSLQSGALVAHPARIVLTCHPQKKDRGEQASSQVVLKPFHVRDLLHAVATALDGETHASLVEKEYRRTMPWDSKRTEAR